MQSNIDELKQHIEQCNILLSNMIEQELKQARAVDKLKQDFDKLNHTVNDVDKLNQTVNDVDKYRRNPYRKNGPWTAPWV
jgi:prefoldin subunit 5